MSTSEFWSISALYIDFVLLLGVLASIAVGLRFWCRKAVGLGTYSDDWLSVVAIVAKHVLIASLFLAFATYYYIGPKIIEYILVPS